MKNLIIAICLLYTGIALAQIPTYTPWESHPGSPIADSVTSVAKFNDTLFMLRGTFADQDLWAYHPSKGHWKRKELNAGFQTHSIYAGTAALGLLNMAYPGAFYVLLGDSLVQTPFTDNQNAWSDAIHLGSWMLTSVNTFPGELKAWKPSTGDTMTIASETKGEINWYSSKKQYGDTVMFRRIYSPFDENNPNTNEIEMVYLIGQTLVHKNVSHTVNFTLPKVTEDSWMWINDFEKVSLGMVVATVGIYDFAAKEYRNFEPHYFDIDDVPFHGGKLKSYNDPYLAGWTNPSFLSRLVDKVIYTTNSFDDVSDRYGTSSVVSMGYSPPGVYDTLLGPESYSSAIFTKNGTTSYIHRRDSLFITNGTRAGTQLIGQGPAGRSLGTVGSWTVFSNYTGLQSEMQLAISNGNATGTASLPIQRRNGTASPFVPNRSDAVNLAYFGAGILWVDNRLHIYDGVAPQISHGSLVGTEDNVLTFTLRWSDNLVPNKNLTVNWSKNESVLFPIDSVSSAQNVDSIVFTMRPKANLSGTDTLHIQVDDSFKMLDTFVVISIQAVNDKPSVVLPIPDQALESGDSIAPIPLAARFADVESENLTFSCLGAKLVTCAVNIGQALTVVSFKGIVGIDTIRVRASDGLLFVEDTVFVNLQAFNNPPQFATSSYSKIIHRDGSLFRLVLLANDATPVTYTALGTLPEWLEISNDTLHGDPRFATLPSYSFKIQASDGSKFDTLNVLLALNDIPKVLERPDAVEMENGRDTTVLFALNKIFDNDAVQFRWTFQDTTLFTWKPSTRVLEMDLPADAVFDDSLVLWGIDVDSGMARVSVPIMLRPFNPPPTIIAKDTIAVLLGVGFRTVLQKSADAGAWKVEGLPSGVELRGDTLVGTIKDSKFAPTKITLTVDDGEKSVSKQVVIKLATSSQSLVTALQNANFGVQRQGSQWILTNRSNTSRLLRHYDARGRMLRAISLQAGETKVLEIPAGTILGL